MDDGSGDGGGGDRGLKKKRINSNFCLEHSVSWLPSTAWLVLVCHRKRLARRCRGLALFRTIYACEVSVFFKHRSRW